MHPNLSYDLLKAQIDAAHEIGVKAVVYISAGYDEKYAKLLEQYGALGWIQNWKSLRQSYGSEHGHDLAFFWGTFPLLSAGSYQTETCPTDWKLFMETTYIRQYNRMLDTLAEIIEKLETTEDQQ